MNINKIISNFSIEGKNLYYRLSVIFSLFFLVPVLGFIFFAIKYEILGDESVPIFFIALLTSSFLGYVLIRRIFDQITSASKRVSATLPTDTTGAISSQPGELETIIRSFESLQRELHASIRNLDKRTAQIDTLKELTDLCYVTFDDEDLFHITLERALKMVNANIGSVLLLDGPRREAFIVQANIGLRDVLHKGDLIDFNDSIAKFAVINKSPILVDDIEKDSRFGRINRSRYGTKSFLCMPIRGINDVLGVMTLSRQSTDLPFNHDDIDVLEPLLSNAAFAYDNLTLMNSNKRMEQSIRVVENIFKIVNSSLRDSELLQAVLTEFRTLIPFDIAVILDLEDPASDTIVILDFLTLIPLDLTKTKSYRYTDSMFEKVIKQGNVLLMRDEKTHYANLLEQELFSSQKLHSGILSPLKLEGRIIGVLFMGSLKENNFDNYQEQIISLSHILPLAIEKNKLNSSIIKRDLEMKSINQIGSLLASSTFEMEGVLRHTMDMIRALMNVEAGSLMLLEKNELHIKVAFNAIVDPDILHGIVIKLGQGIAGYSAARGEPLLVRDVDTSPHFNEEIDYFTKFKTRSALCVPLISQGKVLGVIEVLNKKDGDFNDNDLQLLHSIAASVSIALENARLYQETLSMADHERGIRNMFQKYVPKEVIEKITGDAAGRPVLEELKTLTFLNIDIRSFSNLSRNIGPKRTVAILNHFFSIMGETVFKHHGIVDKYLGDGFLAIFGAPVSSPLDADNAITAALEMKKTIHHINAHIAHELERPLTMGISIHTGEAVVGNIGFEKKMDYTVIGDSVNVVFRMQGLTRSWPDSILISEITRESAIHSILELREIVNNDASSVMGAIKIYELLGKQSIEIPAQ